MKYCNITDKRDFLHFQLPCKSYIGSLTTMLAKGLKANTIKHKSMGAWEEHETVRTILAGIQNQDLKRGKGGSTEGSQEMWKMLALEFVSFVYH